MEQSSFSGLDSHEFFDEGICLHVLDKSIDSGRHNIDARVVHRFGEASIGPRHMFWKG